jgi:hypothetical protein
MGDVLKNMELDDTRDGPRAATGNNSDTTLPCLAIVVPLLLMIEHSYE